MYVQTEDERISFRINWYIWKNFEVKKDAFFAKNFKNKSYYLLKNKKW